jgi:hypothetical protein
METAIVCEDCNEVLTVAAKIEDKIKCSSFIAFIASFANDVDEDSLHSIPYEATPNRDTVRDQLLSDIDEDGDRMVEATDLFIKKSRFNTECVNSYTGWKNSAKGRAITPKSGPRDIPFNFDLEKGNKSKASPQRPGEGQFISQEDKFKGDRHDSSGDKASISKNIPANNLQVRAAYGYHRSSSSNQIGLISVPEIKVQGPTPNLRTFTGTQNLSLASISAKDPNLFPFRPQTTSGVVESQGEDSPTVRYGYARGTGNSGRQTLGLLKLVN